MRCAHQLSQRLGERFRALARANDDKNAGALAVSVRQVNGSLSLRFGELRLFYRPDNADNGEEVSLLHLAFSIT
jgi:hypothetical protein